MSNLATADRLQAAVSQLPAAAYCDQGVFDAEMRQLFSRAPGYVGHELMVPEPGDYKRTFVGDRPVVLARNGEGELRGV